MSLSLVLLAILLFFLLSFFTSSVKAKAKIERAKECVLQRQRFSLRMNQAFSGILSAKFAGGKEAYFYTENEGKDLVFLFDNGIDPNPSFSGPVKGKLFAEKENVYFQVEPLPKKGEKPLPKGETPYRKELLLSHAKEVNFFFLEKVKDALKWQSSWPKGKATIPSMIRLEVIESLLEKEEIKDNLAFAFFLPQMDIPVTYRDKPEVKQ